jgi:hypothetical protein
MLHYHDKVIRCAIPGRAASKEINEWNPNRPVEANYAPPTEDERERRERLYSLQVSSRGENVIENYSKKYNDRAIVPMLKWIEGLIEKPRVVQYKEVIKNLEKFSPKYGCENDFCVDLLLPELERSGKLSQLPESLIIVLHTLYLMHAGGTWLTSVEKEDQDLLFVAEFKVEDDPVPFAYKYRLRNYLSLEDVALEPICDAPAVDYERNHGHDEGLLQCSMNTKFKLNKFFLWNGQA